VVDIDRVAEDVGDGSSETSGQRRQRAVGLGTSTTAEVEPEDDDRRRHDVTPDDDATI